MWNDALERALDAYTTTIGPEVLQGISRTLGGVNEVPSADVVPVYGFFIRMEGSVFSAWLVTPGVFSIYQLDSDKNSLAVSIPLNRIRRVVTSGSGNTYRWTVEIEADRTVLELRGEGLSQTQEVDGQTAIVEKSLLSGSMTSSNYTIASNDAEEEGALVSFFQGMRIALERY